MTTTTILLSSTPSTTTLTVPTIFMYDSTTLIIDTSQVSLSGVPTSIKIRWGDNTPDEYYSADFFNDEGDTINNIIIGNNFSTIRKYTHRYTTSNVSLTQKLSAQLLVKYFTGSTCLFIIPIEITNPSLTNKCGKLSIVAVNSNFNDQKLVTIYCEKEKLVTDIIIS